MGSDELFERAQAVIPGGVNSPVRAYGAVGGTPPFIVRGEGAYVTDADGRRFLDYVQSWGALLFGHARSEIVAAATAAAERGTSFGAPTEGEVELAERIVAMVPSIQMLRLVSSGTEAAMTAVRLARAATGRPRILKFDGCYHGHADGLLERSGSGVATFGLGEGARAANEMVVAPYNDLGAVEAVFEEDGEHVACVIVEPIPANMGVIVPRPGFLEGLRRACDRHGALLIFDEVITGFRVARGGAQELFGIRPDLTCLGKVMGGGFPCAAFGGRADVMELLAPDGPVYQAGTLSGNPVTVAAGLATLHLIEQLDPYPILRGRVEELVRGLGKSLEEAGIPHAFNRVESLFSVSFTAEPVEDFRAARAADQNRFARFFHALLDRGVYLPPSGFEAWFVGAAHGDGEIERTIGAGAEAAVETARATG